MFIARVLALSAFCGSVGAALFMPATAIAQNQEDKEVKEAAESPPVQPEESKASEKELFIEGYFPTSRFEPLPEGFTKSDLSPPFTIGYRFLPKPVANGPAMMSLEANVSFIPTSAAPILGLTPGFVFGGDFWRISAGVSLQAQWTLKKPPFNHSPYSTQIVAPFGAFWFEQDRIGAGLTVKYIKPFRTTLAQLEGFDTQIDFTPTYAYLPELSYRIPAGPFLKAKAGLYVLGNAAIASKEFAIGLESKSVTRWNVSAGWDFGRFEPEISYQLVSGVSDHEALYFQAPVLYPDYLLSERMVGLEIRWKL